MEKEQKGQEKGGKGRNTEEKQQKEEKIMEKTKKGTKKAGKGKTGKRAATWQEMVKNRERAITKEGQEMGNLTRENMETILLKDGETMAAKWDILTLGYHITSEGKPQKEKDSNYRRVTGERKQDTLGRLYSNNNGYLLQISIGGYKNHFLFIIPNSEIMVKNTSGQDITINRQNYKNTHYQIFTNHGRSYRAGDLLGFQHSLYYTHPGRGIYFKSTPTTYNYKGKNKDTGDWEIYTKTGNTRKAPHPWDLLENLEKHGMEYGHSLISNKSLENYK